MEMHIPYRYTRTLTPTDNHVQIAKHLLGLIDSLTGSVNLMVSYSRACLQDSDGGLGGSCSFIYQSMCYN